MSSNHSTLQHPFLSYSGLQSSVDQQDALNNCANVLALLADLFGSDAEDFSTLDSVSARRGMWLQLQGIANVLTAVSAAIANSQSAATPE